MCELYGATGEMRGMLVAKAESNDDTTINLPSGDKYTDQLANIMLLETEARRVTNCEIALVPGLLQTAEYARQMMATVDRPQSEIERRVATRIGRQAVLSRPNGPELRFLIDLENRKGGIFVTDGNTTQQYVESRDALWDVALGEEETVGLIDALEEGLNDD